MLLHNTEPTLHNLPQQLRKVCLQTGQPPTRDNFLQGRSDLHSLHCRTHVIFYNPPQNGLAYLAQIAPLDEIAYSYFSTSCGTELNTDEGYCVLSFSNNFSENKEIAKVGFPVSAYCAGALHAYVIMPKKQHSWAGN